METGGVTETGCVTETDRVVTGVGSTLVVHG
jgi:hypothetical protein